MKSAAHASKLLLIALALTAVLVLAPEASAQQPTANQLLLSDGSGNSPLAPTSTTVPADRFNIASASFLTGVTDVKFCVEKIRTDIQLWDRIASPLRVKRDGVKWDEYNMLVSGIGFNLSATYPFGVAQGQGRYLNVRVMVPRDGWNGRLVFWHHGSADTQLLTYTPVIEPELLLSRGYAVAEAQFNGIVPAQQNPNAVDDSYWKAVDEMYQSDPASYWSYAVHPDWFSNSGVAISDGATLRNLAGLVKNLLYRERGCRPSSTYWLGWSAGGGAGTAVNTGRDRLGNYTGGDFVVPYDKTSGKVFDAFMALEPVYSATAPVDKQFPVAAPYFFVDGTLSPLSLEAPNALNFARKVKTALDGPDADPSLSKNIDSWVRLYTQKYGNHDWMGRFFETVHNGDDNPHPVYYDTTKPLAERFNTEGRGRQLNWVMGQLWRTSPKYLTDWADENLAGWGQLTFSYYQLNDAYHTALFDHLVAWSEQGVTPPTSRIDPALLDPAQATYPKLPVNDPTQDSLNRNPSSIVGNADITWQRTNPGALTVVPDMIQMPHVTARWGIYLLGYKIMVITPFTAAQLTGGYHVGNIDFAGYADEAAYQQAFSQAVQSLVSQGWYDPEIAARFANGDPGMPPLPFP
jgi:hypothetical protein